MDTTAAGSPAPLRLPLLHDRGARDLATALTAAVTAHGLRFEPLEVEGDAAVEAARRLVEDGRVGVHLSSDGRSVDALKVDRLWQQHRHAGHFLIASPRGLEVLAGKHPGQAPCAQCFETQLDQFPWLHEHADHAPTDGQVDAFAATIAAWLLDDDPARAWQCLRLTAGRAETLRVLRDPVCPHCSDWSRRPTQTFYVTSTEAA